MQTAAAAAAAAPAGLQLSRAGLAGRSARRTEQAEAARESPTRGSYSLQWRTAGLWCVHRLPSAPREVLRELGHIGDDTYGRVQRLHGGILDRPRDAARLVPVLSQLMEASSLTSRDLQLILVRHAQVRRPSPHLGRAQRAARPEVSSQSRQGPHARCSRLGPCGDAPRLCLFPRPKRCLATLPRTWPRCWPSSKQT